jgi:hypothetical protein
MCSIASAVDQSNLSDPENLRRHVTKFHGVSNLELFFSMFDANKETFSFHNMCKELDEDDDSAGHRCRSDSIKLPFRLGTGRAQAQAQPAGSGSGFYSINPKHEPSWDRFWAKPTVQTRSPQTKPGQARKSLSLQYKARPRPAFYRPDPAIAHFNLV